MYRIVKRLEFCYGHRLLDYEGKCAQAHGHNGILEVELASERLDSAGMIVDFGEIKRLLSRFIDDELDHRMLLRKDDPLVEALRSVGEEAFLMADNPTAENIAKMVFAKAQELGLPVIAVRLWETPDAVAEFRPRRLGRKEGDALE